MSAAPPHELFWVRWDFKKHLGDTLHLDAELHGAYCFLVFAYYARGGPLPDDDAQLAVIARVSQTRWKRIRQTLLAFFTVTGDGFWRHKRADEELAGVSQSAEFNKERGRQAARARWSKHRNTHAKPCSEHARSMSGAMLGDTESESESESDTNTPLPPDGWSSGNGKPDLNGTDSVGFQEALRKVEDVWAIWPKKVGTQAGKLAIRAAIRRHGFEAVRDGTAKIAAAAAERKTSIPGQFLPRPDQFFDASGYLDDPAHYGPRQAVLSATELRRLIDAEAQRLAEHPGNPANTEGSLDRKASAHSEWIEGRDRLKGLREQLAKMAEDER